MHAWHWVHELAWLKTPLVAGGVSLGVTSWFRWRDKEDVVWVPLGVAWRESPGPWGVNFQLIAHNVGKGSAYNVRSIRRNAPQFRPFEEFESSIVRAGETVCIDWSPWDWDTCELGLVWSANPKATSIQGRLGSGLLGRWGLRESRSVLDLEPRRRWGTAHPFPRKPFLSPVDGGSKLLEDSQRDGEVAVVDDGTLPPHFSS